jgi:hypothetical protein
VVVAEAVGALLHHLGTPAVLLVHSVSGHHGFRVVEEHGELLRALWLRAAMQHPAAPPILRATDTQIEIAHVSVTFVLSKHGRHRRRHTPTEIIAFSRGHLIELKYLTSRVEGR